MKATENMDRTYQIVDRPVIAPEEMDAIEEAEYVIGGICRATRPETLGYQNCWRLSNHEGAHVSQDRTAWIAISSDM